MKNLLLSALLCLPALAANAQCSVTASFSTTPGSQPKTVVLTNSSTVTNQPSNSMRQSAIRIWGNLQGIGNSTSLVVTLPFCGNQSVTLITQVIDSTTQQVLCVDSVTQTVNAVCPPCWSTFNAVNGQNGQVTFYALNAANTPGLTYTWLFGDGTSATGNQITHTYPANGNYTVKLISSASSVPCIDSTSASVNITNLPLSNCQSSISKSYGSNGSITFNASTVGGTTGKTYTWYFGDGTSGTGRPITHMYPANGTYTVKLVTTGPSCTDSTTTTASITNKQSPCYTTTTKTIGSNGQVTFTANTPGGSGMIYNWNFGDGNSGTGSPITHTYANLGTYAVKLYASSSTNQCNDSAVTNLTIGISSIIAGGVFGDSTSTDTFKVWLIQFDSMTNNLYAVDSQIVSNGSQSVATYVFYNKPNGIYRTKAHQLDGPTSGIGYFPTYHLNSLFWNSASLIHHSGGNTTGKHIYMQTGTVTSGPGFIGGNVTLGANKGTSNGIAGQLVFVRDNNDKVLAMTYTDNNGDYLFQNLPLGTYSIYPEDGGYTTTPATITLTGIISGSHNVHFEKHEVSRVITPKPTSVKTVVDNGSFNIYPNPTSGILKLDLGAISGKAAVRIADMTGKNAFNQQLQITGAQESINVSHLRPGQYFITVEAGGKVSTQKFMLEK